MEPTEQTSPLIFPPVSAPRIAYSEGFKYQLRQDYVIQTSVLPMSGKDVITEFICLSARGLLWIKDGYAWDGPSGPTWDSPSTMRSSLVHDAVYQLLREELVSQKFRVVIDEKFHDLCIEDGMWSWRAKVWHVLVRDLAMSAANPENEKKIIWAPK